MKCPNCGKEIANDSKFCEFCGEKINHNAENSSSCYDSMDRMYLDIIFVGSKHKSILASNRARQKCYRIAMSNGRRYDYKEHIQKLQIDNFPDEFKKSAIGESYKNWLALGIFFSILSLGLIVCFAYLCAVFTISYLHVGVFILGFCLLLALIVLSIVLCKKSIIQCKKKRKEFLFICNN